MANEVDFMVGSHTEPRSVDKATIKSLGGHPLLQVARISIPSNTYLLCRPKGSTMANILQITAQLEIIDMRIEARTLSDRLAGKRQKVSLQDPITVGLSIVEEMEHPWAILVLSSTSTLKILLKAGLRSLVEQHGV